MKAIGPIRFITIHIAFTRPSQDIGVDEIRQWHKARGFADIGYHKVIRRDGTEEEGRDIHLQGAHVGGFNAGNLGICLVGGRAEHQEACEDNITTAQWVALFHRVREWHHQYPDAIILGHNGFPGHEARGCPCFNWKKWRAEFFQRMKETPTQLPSHWYSELDLEGP